MITLWTRLGEVFPGWHSLLVSCLSVCQQQERPFLAQSFILPAYNCKEATDFSDADLLQPSTREEQLRLHSTRSARSLQVLVEVVRRVVIRREDMERVSIDLHIASNGHVCGRDERLVLVNVLVLSLVEELAFDDARVLLGGLVDANVVISQVEGNDEPTVNILRHASVELGRETQDLLVVVHSLEEVTLGLLRDQLVHLSKRVLLVSEPVIGGSLWRNRLGWLLELYLTERELVSVLLLVVLLSHRVHAVDHVDATVRVDV